MIGAWLGLASCAAMTCSAICCAVPMSAMPPMQHGEQQQPMPDHQTPVGCHGVLGCGDKRKLRTIP